MLRFNGVHKILIFGLICSLILWGILSGCRQKQVRREPVTVAVSQPSDQVTALEAANQELEKALAASKKKSGIAHGKIAALERELTGLQLMVLEKEALTRILEQRLESQQKRMDDAIIEVVRAKAKLRSIESKAEAASTIAEAEIAVRALKNQVAAAGIEDFQTIVKARQLLEISTKEFQRENFGGALYLAGQAQRQVRTGHMLLGGDRNISPLEGEVAFAQPLPLRVLKNSNFRTGPGLTFKILTELKEGTLIIGYAHKEDWVRVHTESGATGWIFQSLVGIR